MKKWIEIAVVLLLGTLILLPKWTTIATILVVVLSVINIIKKKSNFKFSWALMIMPLFYLLYLIGLINTEDFAYAGMDLGSKLSLIIFPLLFSFPQKLDFRLIKQGFVLVCLASGLISIVSSAMLFNADAELGTGAFRGSYLGYKIHTTYLSWYYSIAILMIIDAWFKKKTLFILWVDGLLILFFLPFLYLLGSFAGLLLAVIYFGLILIKWIKSKFGKKAIIISFIAVLGVLTGSFLIPSIKGDVSRGLDEFAGAFTNKETYFKANKNQTESFKARAMLWSVASEKVAENPMGYGTGDGKNTFVSATQSYGLTVGAKKLNPHNQYFQTTLAIGIIGLICLCTLLFLQLKLGIQNQSFLLICLTLGLAFHCLFESILELQSGIVFFTLVSSLLINEIQTSWKHSKNG